MSSFRFPEFIPTVGLAQKIQVRRLPDLPCLLVRNCRAIKPRRDCVPSSKTSYYLLVRTTDRSLNDWLIYGSNGHGRTESERHEVTWHVWLTRNRSATKSNEHYT